jgi:membrane fusion protein (multidrug efflux system)
VKGPVVKPPSTHRDPGLSAPQLAAETPPRSNRLRPRIPWAIGLGASAVLAIGALMVVRAESKTNKVALADSAKLVSVIEAKGTTFRPSRTYIGTIRPWVEASVGPQLVSAYVDTVLVRPGAVVKKGDVLATLDCRNATAMSQAVAMQARALEARQHALAHEAARVKGLLDGGFVSPNDAEQKAAQSDSEQAQLLAARAKLLGTSLEVNDCVLRAPFDGEIASRSMDPGAFARPGAAIVSVVDRSTVRVVVDAPEVDFDILAPGTQVQVQALAIHRDFVAKIARRAPAADLATRTVHFELDVADAKRELPVGTTADVRIEVGEPEAASEIPLAAATVRGSKATLFVVDQDTAHKQTFPVKGEREGRLFVDSSLAPGSRVVTEGRALLNDKDKVAASLERPVLQASAAPPVTP